MGQGSRAVGGEALECMGLHGCAWHVMVYPWPSPCRLLLDALPVGGRGVGVKRRVRGQIEGSKWRQRQGQGRTVIAHRTSAVSYPILAQNLLMRQNPCIANRAQARARSLKGLGQRQTRGENRDREPTCHEDEASKVCKLVDVGAHCHIRPGHPTIRGQPGAQPTRGAGKGQLCEQG